MASNAGVASWTSNSFADTDHPVLEMTVPESACKLKYDKMKSWYIHRTFVQLVIDRGTNVLKPIRDVVNIKHKTKAPKYSKFESYTFSQLPSWNKFCVRPGVELGVDIDVKESMFILLDIHRAGKTAYFTWLAWHIQTYDRLLYVIHLNAAEHGSCFEWLRFKYYPDTIDTEVIRTLFRLSHHARTVRHMDASCTIETIQEERKHTDRLAELFTFADGMVLLDESKLQQLALTSNQLTEVVLFHEKINHKKVVFILDGADQVKPRCRTAVLQFIERLSHFDGVQKIFLSTNPECASSVVNLFPNGRNKYQLEALCDCDSILLLQKFLLSQLHAYCLCGRELQLKLATFLHCAIKDALPLCCLTPPERRMVFSLCLPVIKRCLDFKDQRVRSIGMEFKNIDSFQLIKRLIDERLDGSSKPLLTPSASTWKQAMTSTLKRQLALLAFYTMANEYYSITTLLTFDERTYAIKLKNDCNEDIVKCGFLTMNYSHTWEFGNQLFAEYFAACWIFENRSRLSSKRHRQSLCVMFAAGNFQPILNMFNRITKEGCAGIMFHVDAYDERYLNASLLKDLDNISGKDNIGRTALHWIQQSPYQPGFFGKMWYDMILQTIPKQLIDAKDELFRWSAVDFAFYHENWNFLDKCLRLGAKVDIEVWLDQLRLYDTPDMFLRIARLEWYLFNPNTTIPDTGLARHILCAVSSGIVKHLIYQRHLDIRSPVVPLSRLTVLEYCATHDLINLFEHFISITATSNKILNEIGHRLFELSVQHDAYRVTVYLMDRCGFETILLQSSARLDYETCPEYGYLLCAMELKSMKVFQLFFNLMCKNYKFDCIMDEEVVEESCKATINTHLTVRHNANQSTFMPTCHLLATCEKIICEALYRTKFHIISYIVQKIKLQVSHHTLTTIIKILRKQTRVLPEASSSILNYLLDKTDEDELYSTNEDGETLLHMAGSIGCIVWMHCLLDRGFYPPTPCKWVKRNMLHYVAAQVEDQRAIEIIHQLRFCSIDQLNVPDSQGHNVCDLAIRYRKYRLAHMLIHTKASYFTTEKRMSAVLDSFTGLLKSNEFKAIVDFLAFSFKHTDNDWKDVYAIIHREMPIV